MVGGRIQRGAEPAQRQLEPRALVLEELHQLAPAALQSRMPREEARRHPDSTVAERPPLRPR